MAFYTLMRLLTAFGDDVYAQKLAAVCGELGIDISQSPVIPGGHTSTYLFINDQQGDMQLAVSDMDIYRNLTPRVLAGRKQLLEGSQVVVIDTNLPAESIAWLADNCHAPIFADPVSTVKAEKLRPVLGKLHTLKPNRLEAELLSGVPITGTDSLHRAAQTLLETGLHRVFISLGADGVYAADQSGSVTLPAPKAEMVSTTGCGDSFMAALTWAYLQGSDLERSARAGLAASSLTMESAETIHPSMSEAELLRRIAADGTRSVLFSTHITSDLEKCASHITFIQEGRLQRSDTLAGFMAHYADLGSTLEEIIVAAERRPYDADAII